MNDTLSEMEHSAGSQGLTPVHFLAQREQFLSHVVGCFAGFSDKNGSGCAKMCTSVSPCRQRGNRGVQRLHDARDDTLRGTARLVRRAPLVASRKQTRSCGDAVHASIPHCTTQYWSLHCTTQVWSLHDQHAVTDPPSGGY